MNFLQIKDTTLKWLVNHSNLWIIDKIPSPSLSLDNKYVVHIEMEVGDTMADLFRKILLACGIEPHREHYKRGLQLQSALQHNRDMILVVSNADLMGKQANFRKFVLISEEIAGVFIQGNVFTLGSLAQTEMSFIMQSFVGVHAQTVEH